jgi:hypothetical protein
MAPAAAVPGGRIAHRIKKVHAGRAKHRVMSPIEFLARLAALVPPPRYPLVRYSGVLGPRSPWRRDVVPKAPASTGCDKAGAQCAKASGVMRVAGPGPTGAGPRNRSASERARAAVAGPRSQAAIPTRTTPLPIASLVGTEADVHPAVAHILTEHELRLNPNVLSVAHWSRLLGGALYAATTRVDWATLLRRSFEVDVLACARCGGRLRVLGEVTAPALVQLVLESLGLPGHAPSAARARDPTSLLGDTANV